MPKVLIIDDSDDIRTVLGAYLAEHGWEVVEEEGGAEAVDVAALEQPDAILLDVMMPDKSGFDVFQELRRDERTQHLAVVMLTAVNDFELGAYHDAESVGMRLNVPPPEAFLDKDTAASAILAALNELAD